MNSLVRKLLAVMTDSVLERILIKVIEHLDVHGFTITDYSEAAAKASMA